MQSTAETSAEPTNVTYETKTESVARGEEAPTGGQEGEGRQRYQEIENIEIEKLADHYEAQLGEAGFFYPEAKAENMKMNLRNLWSRMPLTRSDVQMLHGIMRQMVRWKNKS